MHILHLEDNTADAELVAEILRSEWPECRIELVVTAGAFRQALLRREHDLVLSDFSLPDFSGFEALQMVRSHAPDLPFVFVSGNIGEDRAIEAVRNGAQDYVLKDRLKRLPPVIQRVLRELTERRRLIASETERKQLAAVLEITPDLVGIAAPDGTLRFLNSAARHMLGLGQGPLPAGMNLADIYTPSTELSAPVILAEAAETGLWSGESTLRSRSGQTFPVSHVLLAHRDPHGAITHFSSVMRDLTAQKHIETLISGQKQILEMVAAGLPPADVLHRLVHFIESQADDILCSMHVLTDDGRTLQQIAAPSLPHGFVASSAIVAVGEGYGSCGTAAHRRSPVFVADIERDPIWTRYRAEALAHDLRACWSTPIFDRDHQLMGTFAVYHRTPAFPSKLHLRLIDAATHIAAICLGRHRSDQQLRTQAEILDRARDAIVVFDLHHRVTYWNEGAQRIFGWTAAEVIGRRDQDLLSTPAHQQIEALRQVLQDRDEWQGEIQIHDKAQRPLTLECRTTRSRDEHGEPRGWLAIATDITDRKRVEEQFLRAQRLESIGMLAAGIAHDLNNVLAPMLLAAPMLRDHLSEPGDLSVIDALEKSAERGSALVRQILSFAHGADGEHSVIQVKHLLRDLVGLIEQTFSKAIKLEEHIPRDLWTINANPTQIHQVLLNLCVNARDAMPKGGRLTLAADNQNLDELAASAIPGAHPGMFLVLRVEDTGTGMPPEVLAKIWDPFYTTKGAGKGTGLGLSTVRGIVANHSGFMSVESVVGRGTSFRVYLPAADPSAIAAKPPAPELLPAPGRGELILVVDDETNVRDMTATILRRHGYRVVTASDGSDAVALFAARPRDFALVLTDFGMPNLDGAALAAVLRRLRPDIRILMSSGLSGEADDRPAAVGNLPRLLKPFRSETLLVTVDSLLKRSAIA